MKKDATPQTAYEHFVVQCLATLGDTWHTFDNFTELSVSWTTGGLTGGSCWGGEANMPVEAAPEPELDSLDKILEVVCPQITFLQYKSLCRALVERDEKTNSDYYGNYHTEARKRVKLERLYLWLQERGYLK